MTFLMELNFRFFY